MEITVKKEDIVSALNTTLGVVEKKHTIPILANVLFEVEENILHLTATDLTSEVTTNCPLVNVTTKGKTTISARKLNDLCRLIPDGEEINIAMSGEKINIKTINGKYSLSTLPSEDFPIFSSEDENTFLSIPSQDLRDLILSTSFAIDVSGWKDWLMGLFITANDGELIAVASDAIRLATAKKTIEANYSFSGVVPRKSVNEISRFLSDHSGNVDFAINDSTVLLSTENLMFKSKLISGGHNLDYFQRVIPSGDGSVLECNTKELLEALNRISVLANDNLYNEVHLHASSEGMKLYANTKLSELAEESAKSSLSGDGFKLVINGSVLKEAITHIKTDTCHINFFGLDKVILISPPNTDEQQYIVQPVKPVTLGSENIPAEATASNID